MFTGRKTLDRIENIQKRALRFVLDDYGSSYQDGTSYLLCSMYRPPSASHDYYDKMIENIELVSMLNKEIMIFGDLNFNYKLDESLSSNPVRLIENLFQLSQIVTEPTRKTLTS